MCLVCNAIQTAYRVGNGPKVTQVFDLHLQEPEATTCLAAALPSPADMSESDLREEVFTFATIRENIGLEWVMRRYLARYQNRWRLCEGSCSTRGALGGCRPLRNPCESIHLCASPLSLVSTLTTEKKKIFSRNSFFFGIIRLVFTR